MSTDALANPVINSPYDEPSQYFVIGPNGPTGEKAAGRRPSEFFVPVPKPKKRGKQTEESQDVLFEGLGVTGEKITKNAAIDQLRQEVQIWRQRDYDRATAISRKLLRHWADPSRENRVLFAQREAAETAIYLAEVVGRRDYSALSGVDWRDILRDSNETHNSGLPRVALKLATGTGKTVVMAMLIAWHTLNKIASPNDARFAKRFLVVTPGITIRDRLKVLQPEDPENYYDLRGLVPADLRQQLGQAQIEIHNYHVFLPKLAKEIKGVSANTRKLLLGGKAIYEDPFTESPQAIASRVMRSLGTARGEIVVFNDEGHHCYQQNTTDRPEADLSNPGADMKVENADATVWFKGLQYLKRHTGVKTIYDLSATPFYLKGSGWSEGLIFPWTVCDFSLMDAIESGIVKVPRVPVDDDSANMLVSYLHLYDQIKDDPNWPKSARAVPPDPGTWVMPTALEGAMRSLYASYERSFIDWEQRLKDSGEPPPVMIVVSPNTHVSKLIFDWLAGYDITIGSSTRYASGRLELFSNNVNDQPLARPRTILVDSRQLESGDALKPEFRKAAADEIEAFKRAYRETNPGADTESLSDADVLREVMNTVGKRGKLGEKVRCVVSVAMLTEGWDANTVTHILGIRAFGSQLLCEQVVGRGLRRRFYVPEPDSQFFAAEYSNVYGIPFAFIPSDRPLPPGKPPEPSTDVVALAERQHLEITFPVLRGYRVEIPDTQLIFDPSEAHPITIDKTVVPTWVQAEGIVGEPDRIEGIKTARPQMIAFEVASRVLSTFFTSQGDARPWLFPRLVEFTKQYIASRVHLGPGFDLGYLSLTEPQQVAAEAIYNAITRLEGDDARRPRLQPIMRAGVPSSSTGVVSFRTRKKVEPTQFSHVNNVTLDGKDGNAWERALAQACERLAEAGLLTSYVKNDHLGFEIPYVHKGIAHVYWPDFLLKLSQKVCADAVNPKIERYLIVEVSGTMKSPGPTKEKARTARDSWCVAVNNYGAFGRWGYLELGKAGVDDADNVLRTAIRSLVHDEPIIGDPDMLNRVLRAHAGTASTMEN